MVNSFLVSSDILKMFIILYKVIKILHEKMLKSIYLYWFHNYTSEKVKLLNDHSNEPWING